MSGNKSLKDGQYLLSLATNERQSVVMFAWPTENPCCDGSSYIDLVEEACNAIINNEKKRVAGEDIPTVQAGPIDVSVEEEKLCLEG